MIEIVHVLLGFSNKKKQKKQLVYRRYLEYVQTHMVLDGMFTPMVYGLWMRVKGLHNYMDTSLGLCVKWPLELA